VTVRRRQFLFALPILLLLIVIALGLVRAASNSLPPSAADDLSLAASLAELAPSECAGLTLTNLVEPSGGGTDALLGGNGTDVCCGGPGSETFSSCETQVP
jgi:hypothetical protein